MTFPLPPAVHPKARAWLQRSSNHLAKLKPPQQLAWLREWIPAARRFPINDGLTAMDLSIVLDTLINWQADVMAQKEAA